MRRTITTVAFFAALVAVLAAAAPVTADSDIGRQPIGQFCTNPQALPKPGACIALSFDGQTAFGYTNSPDRVIALRPGTYWLTVDDNSSVHNFSLQSPDGSDQDITGVAETPGWVTLRVNLTHGSWVLFCKPHRDMGMYVVIEVGGVGQDG
jgi:plastocyanin